MDIHLETIQVDPLNRTNTRGRAERAKKTQWPCAPSVSHLVQMWVFSSGQTSQAFLAWLLILSHYSSFPPTEPPAVLTPWSNRRPNTRPWTWPRGWATDRVCLVVFGFAGFTDTSAGWLFVLVAAVTSNKVRQPEPAIIFVSVLSVNSPEVKKKISSSLLFFLPIPSFANRVR